MSLLAGTRLGPYEVVAPVGAGGMGEVYRARDPRLGREVAIKVLPSAFSSDAERLHRFEQEARAAAALNHPNILAVHDLGQHDGAPYIVSELLEGETLRERLGGGAQPVRKVVEYAIQIAHGLAAAHEKSITHRDLKPENVFVTTDGRVKILDFGLAKLTQAEPAAAALSALSTRPPDTLPGVVLGTLGYMSPEQVRGLPADGRSDIFAFGAILYEMLSGQRAFRGDTAMDTMTAILKEDPADLPLAERHIPPALERIVDRCLEKNPTARFQSAGDLAFALEGLSSSSGAASVVAGSIRPARRERLWMTTAAILLIGMAALAIPAILYFREAPPAAAPEMRAEITTPATTDPISFALSPDGRQIVFVASGDAQPRLWLRPLDKVTAQPLAGTDGAGSPFWSPDSRSIGFFAETKLKRIDLAGGSPQTLANAINRGGTWSLDGVILFARTAGSPLFRIPASGGEAVAVTKLEKQTGHRFPQFLPGGRQFLFYAVGTPETGGIYLGSLDAPETKRLTAADAAGGYAPGGWLLFVRAGTLLARRLDLARRELTGDPVTVADPVAFDAGTSAGAVSVSAAGLVAYRAGGANNRHLTWFDRSGKTLGTVGAPDGSLFAPHLSPDDRRAAVARTVQGNVDVWLLDAARTTRFTFDARGDRFPIWSPDGSRIVFDSNRKGVRNLYQKPSSGAGSEELLVESVQDKTAMDWSADGRFILYTSIDPQTTFDLWVLPLEGDRKPFVFLKTSFDERRPQFSPDGRWVAYQSNESGRFEIYVRPFPGPGGQWQVSTAGGISPRWGPSGKELDYIAPDGTLMAAPIAVNGATIEPGAPAALFHTRIYGGGTELGVGTNYDIARDGRLLINTVLEDAAVSPITLLQNWKPPAK